MVIYCANVHTIFISGKYSATLLDFGGAKEWRDTWPAFYPICHGIIYVYDANDRERARMANSEIAKIFAVTENKNVLM